MWYKTENDGLTLHIYVQPGAKSTEIVGFHGEALKVRLNAPAIEGRANEALLKYIAKVFDVPNRQVSLVRGEKSRLKWIRVVGSKIDLSSILAILN